MRILFCLTALVFMATSSVHAAEDCQSNKKSVSYNLLKTAHTVLYPLPEVCKPQLVADFTAIKDIDTSVYQLNWSKQDHDLWHVKKYELRVNGTEIHSYAHDVALPISLAVAGIENGLAAFEVRACSSLDEVEFECGDWQSTATQCENWCTDNSYQVPLILPLAAVSTSGDFQVNWTGGQFSDYELQMSVAGNQFTTNQEGSGQSRLFENQSNGIYAFQVRNRNGNIYSKFSPVEVLTVTLQIPSFDYLPTVSSTGDYTVSWNEVNYDAQVERYKLLQSTDGVDWTLLSDTKTYSFDFINQANNLTYHYKVKACRVDNNCSDFSAPISTLVQLESPVLNDLPAINITGNYTVSWDAVSYDEYVVRYRLLQSTNGIDWDLISDEKRYSYDFINQPVNVNYQYKVKACRADNNCSVFSQPVQVVVSDLSLDSFEVYQDTSTQTRFFDWQINPNTIIPEVTHLRLRMYDDQLQIIEQLLVGINDSSKITSRNLLPNSYGLSLCTPVFCGVESIDSVFQQGLTKVSDVQSEWDTSTQGDFKVKISFAYPADVFTNAFGEPHYFAIKPMFDNQAVEIQVPAGSSPRIKWTSRDISQNEYLGDDFTLKACRNDIGCGAPYYLALSEPIASDSVPVPEIVINSSDCKNFASNTTFNLCWEFPGKYTEQQILDQVDYIEIIESQPFGTTNSYIYKVGYEINYPRDYSGSVKDVKFYTDDVLGPLPINRLTRGTYNYKIKACVRDRVNGDSCSASSDSENLLWEVRRNELSSSDLNRVADHGWYQDGSEVGIKWQFNNYPNDNTPDTFVVQDWNHPNTYCINYLNPEKTEYTADLQVLIDYSKLENNTFDLKNYCDDFKNKDSGVLTDPTGTWAIIPCYNGGGCGGFLSSGEPRYKIDFSNPSHQVSAPLTEPNLGVGIIGGPGDMLPGGWWNPDQDGTGWHFYWASELRYPSVHDNYGKTYDLLGYWMAYMEVEGVWTPTWFFSMLKQTEGNDNSQFFQGNLLYVTHNGLAAEPVNVGRLQVYFDQGSNRNVRLKFDIDSEGGVFSSTQANPLPGSNNGSWDEIEIEIESQNNIINGSLAGLNNDDHYSGSWTLTNTNGAVDDKLTWLVWLERYLEVSTIFTFDTDGKPIWLQAETCTPNSELDPTCRTTNYPHAGYFDSYITDNGFTFKTVKNGFNPLGRTPDSFELSEELVYLGNGGRSLTGLPGYTKGQFWMDVNNNLVEGDLVRTLDLDYGSRNSLMPMDKSASFHDIRFFVNNQDETVTTCDPNVGDLTECQIKFTWFTDDDFPSIEPYYSFNDGSGWTAQQPLDNLCPNVPMGIYVVTNFDCDNFTEAGEYKFFLRKDNYATGQAPVIIAESNKLTIVACDDPNCNSAVTPLPAEPAPMVDNQMDFISVDPINDTVGVTAGAFDVDESGSVNYTLPIYAPKGRGGLAPQLALSYNSNAGNGIAGQGWNISGTSAITRCLRSQEHDPGLTYYPPISMSWDDVFCLDGMRLFKVAESATEIEYRTEIANFSKIIATKDDAFPNGPRHFQVSTKSGEIWTYGSSGVSYKANNIFPSGGTGAQIIANDDTNTVHSWLLAQIVDKSAEKNRIRFVYDSLDGESYLSYVKWSNFGANESPHYQINFNYSTNARSDAMYHFGIGTEYKSLLNLESVSTLIRTANLASAPLQEVRRLKLNYEEPYSAHNPTGVKRLISAQQCLNNGTCLMPVEFTWDNGDTAVGLDSAVYEGDNIGKLKDMGFGSYKPIDLNGDGLMEMIFVRGYDKGNWLIENNQAMYWIVANRSQINIQGVGCELLSNSNNDPHFDYMCSTDIQPFHADRYDDFTAEKWFVYDFNGDGYQDVLTPQRNGNQDYDELKIFYSNGSQLCLNNSGACSGYEPHNTTIKQYHVKGGSSFLDYTADGVPDLLTFDEKVNGTETIYNYKLYPSARIQRGGIENGFSPVIAGSEFVEINTDQLEPNDLKCDFTGSISGSFPCMLDPTNLDQVGRLFAGKIEQTGTDFNGDGYNDALYTYRYVYSSIENCTDHFNVGIIPRSESPTEDPINLIAENQYSVDLLTNESDGLNGSGPSGSNCEHQFKAAMLYKLDDLGKPTFTFAGRIGILNNYSDNNSGNDSQPSNVQCNGDSIESGCGLFINNTAGGVNIYDVNGDSLGDLVVNVANGLTYYKLHTGHVQTATMNNLVANPHPSFEFEKVVFGNAKIMVPAFNSNIYGDGLCDVNDRTDFDDNACARSYLTQYLDYDLDGDLDVLVPNLVSNNQMTKSYYQLYKYGLHNNEFSYGTPILTDIIAFDPSNNQQPQDYTNSFWDINGDSHYDYFSLLRKITEHDTTTMQSIRYGKNQWLTRNKITAVINQVGDQNLDSTITIDYDAATDPNSTVYLKSTGSLIGLTDYGNGSPVFDINAPMYLVSQVGKTSPSYNSPNTRTYVTYAYEGFKIQGGGRGSLGFASVLSHDPYHEITTRTDYHQDFPLIGMPSITQTDHATGQLSYSRSFYAVESFDLLDNHQSVFPYLKRSYERSSQLNVDGNQNFGDGYNITGISLHKVSIADFSYSPTDMLNGNLTKSVIHTCPANTPEPTIDQSLATICGTSGNKLITQKTTENTYDDDNAKWLLGRLNTSKTTEKRLINSVNGALSYSSKYRESAFDYDPVTGQLIKEELLGGVNQYLKTLYQYDDYGQSIAKYQCSNQLTDSQCAVKPDVSRPSARHQVHRYSLTNYDTDWNEYVEYQTEPFTTYDAFAHNDTAQLENTTSAFVLDQGHVNEVRTSYIYADLLNGGKKRDIYGNPFLVADANQYTSRSVYGVFGEVHATAGEAGGSSKVTKRWCDDNYQTTYRCPAMASTVIINQSSGQPISRKYYDVLGREVRSQVQNFNGQWQTTDTQYDVMGRTVKQTEPFTVNDADQITSDGGTFWTETKYDPLDRVVLIKSPGHCLESTPAVNTIAPSNPSCANIEVFTTTDYSGLSVSTTNSKNQTTTQLFDLNGQVIKSIDAMGYSVDYGYDAHGNLTETTSYLDGSPITINMSYDSLGRKVSMYDPDKGAWSYVYNPVGELIQQNSANTGSNWSVKNWYDIRGRLIFRMDADGTRSVWEYDDPLEYGLLQKEHSRGKYQSEGVAQSKTYIYDGFKRLEEVLTTVYDEQDSNTPAIVTYKSKTVFDGVGRVFQQYDNIDQSFDNNHHGVQYFYNQYGYQEAIKDAENGLLGQEYYRVFNVNHRGQVVYERHHGEFNTWKYYAPSTGFLQSIDSWDEFGNVTQSLSYAFDQIGNLIRRTDAEIYNDDVQRHINEIFIYDELNRLKNTYRDANDVGSGTYNPELRARGNMSYDESGNILYNTTTTLGGSLNMEYQHPSKPHAVTRAFRNNGSVDKTYHYDNNGNVTKITQTGDINNVISSFEYSSYDHATLMASNGWVSDVYYNNNRSRFIRKDRKADNSESRATLYLGSVEYVYKDGEVNIKRHLGNVVIESKDHNEIRSRWKYSYLLKDHLGSTHTVVNKQGQQIERFSFTAWGERRRPPMPSIAPNIFWPYFSGWDSYGDKVDKTTNRGFTGHEHFDQVGIIHMNGRIYDPTIGRFLQADPIIQDPYNTQSLNRYSYVMNNPLSYTDPTGYSRLRSGWWRMPVAIAISVYTAGAASAVMSYVNCVANASAIVGQAMVISVVGGAAAGAVMTGTLNGAVKGGVMAAVTFGIGHGGGGGEALFGQAGTVMSHSIVSGVSAEVDGGKFGHGFASALISQNVGKGAIFDHNEVGRAAIVSNAILQGSISELTGGKFANGAMSGAFRVAFNDFQSTLNKWMNGKMNPSGDSLVDQAKAKANGYSTEDLVTAVAVDYTAPAHSPLTTSVKFVKERYGLSAGFSADAFLGIGGVAVDYTYFQGCWVTSLCSQYGYGAQVGFSTGPALTYSSTGNFFPSNHSIGTFGDFGMGNQVGVSMDYGLSDGEWIIKADRSWGYGSAYGLQYCVVTNKSCGN